MKTFSLLLLTIAHLSLQAMSWQENNLVYTLPMFMRSFTNELKVKIKKKGQVIIAVPQKNPDYWLTPKNDVSDQIIEALFANFDITKATKKQSQILLNSIKAEYPHLKELYESPAYITENHTLEQHTLNVLEQFRKQRLFHAINPTHYKKITKNIDKLLIATIMVHDIGKPLGIRRKQHEFTLPLAEEALTRWGFSSQEIKLSLSLIDNDIIGELVQPHLEKKVTKAYDQLLELATNVGLSLKHYFALQSLFYVCDASSYSFIKSIAFKENKFGYIYPISKQYKQLRALIMQGHFLETYLKNIALHA